MKEETRIWSLLGLGTIGSLISFFQTYQFYQLQTGQTHILGCQIGHWNCLSVLSSSFAEIVSGIPLSTFTAAFYLTVVFAAIFLFENTKRTTFWPLLLLWNSLGWVIGLIYAGIMVFHLKAICLYCFLQDGVLFLLFLLSVTFPFARKHLRISSFGAIQLFFTLFASALIVALLLSLLFKPEKSEASFQDQDFQSFLEDYHQSPSLSFQQDTPLQWGPQNAPIEIIKFSDFQCPACKAASELLPLIKKRYAGKIHFLLKNYPLSSQCNKAVPFNQHTYSCKLAKYAICASKQTSSAHVIEYLFSQQEHFSALNVKKLSQALSISLSKLKTCLKNPETQALLMRDVKEGNQIAHIDHTPTFFINGKNTFLPLSWPFWKKLLDTLVREHEKR